LGTVWDVKHTVDSGDQDLAWNGHLQTAGSQSLDQWTIEMKIPLSDLGVPKGTKELRMNVQRLQQRNQASALWNPVPNLDSRSFGILSLP
jgi:hypothetical protein